MTSGTTIPAIELTIDTGASPEVAWRALTSPEWIALWFTEASPLGEPGSPYELDFGDGSVVSGRVTVHEPGVRFAHTWAWDGAGPAEQTRVEWRVEPLASGGARIVLVHDGWDEAGANQALRDDHEAYWSGYLDDLRDVLEEG